MKLTNTLSAATAIVGAAFTIGTLAFTPAATNYKLDTKASTIEWVGKKVTGQHSGKVLFKEGVINSDGKTLTGGIFTVDMKSMTVEDIKDPETNGKFLGHMSSDDFFGIEKNPTSTFKITNVKKTGANTADVTGDMTLKGKTLPVTFPTSLTMKGNKIMATGTAKIDRTKYDIKYGSGSFFSDLGDKMINDDFEFTYNIVANK